MNIVKGEDNCEKRLSVLVASAMIVGNVGSSISISYANSNDVSRIGGKDSFETCAKLRNWTNVK